MMQRAQNTSVMAVTAMTDEKDANSRDQFFA
jgi:hypothetical protein